MRGRNLNHRVLGCSSNQHFVILEVRRSSWTIAGQARHLPPVVIPLGTITTLGRELAVHPRYQATLGTRRSLGREFLAEENRKRGKERREEKEEKRGEKRVEVRKRIRVTSVFSQ